MADSEASKEDKQLPASERRLKQAAEDGNIARSRDAAHVLVVGTGLATLALTGEAIRTDLVSLLRHAMQFDQGARGGLSDAAMRLLTPIGEASLMVLVVLGVTAVGAIAAGVVPGGLNLSTKALGFKAARLNPAAGLKRIFSIRNLVEFAKLSLLATVLGLIGVWFVETTMPEFASLSLGSMTASVSSATRLVNGGFTVMVLLLVVLATFDVPFQWFRHRADLRMTREEVRKESRESDGDPQLRGQIRAKQREISQRRMLAAVPSADIVIVNPTHYAVAIRYDEATMAAPRVVAKGVDLVAARIQAIARESNVPVLEAPPLARALYAHVKIDQEVPRVLYAAIAQLLAYVFQLKNWVPGRTAAPREPTDLDVPAGMDPKADETGDYA